MGKIKVAIAGLGNCASALIQGTYYYSNSTDNKDLPGLMHPKIGGYNVNDIEFVAAFDVNKDKLGRDISEAIFIEPNSVKKFTEVPKIGTKVTPGPLFDGVAPHMKNPFKSYDPNKITPPNVVEVLKDSKAEILVNYLPVGSYEGARGYAQAAIDAGVAFVNCIPEFIVSDVEWQQKFINAGLPCAGDDIKSQVGATILHRNLVNLLMDRGVKVKSSYQLNIGGNTDFLNMTSEARLKSKRISKTQAVTSLLPYHVSTRIGPSDYVDFVGDKKICYIWLDGVSFGGFPIRIDAKLLVEDSPNSAGVVIDVIRGLKLALDRKISGPLISFSAYFFKHPPKMIPDSQAKVWVEEFITGKRKD